ncbi:MAG TPA: DUF2127 domain-containing protein [Candidatus Nitrosopolaris sp.]|nr:DUF2127 domain-containing protein [Candidatus Nitrosopolaris sp.]
MQIRSRPFGVTIIAILIIIAGVISLFIGIGAVAIGPLIGLVFVVIGAISLALGVAYLVMAYGLWKGKGWAWTISTIILFIGIVIDIISLPRRSTGDIVSSIVSIAINAVILYYLYRPHVKAYFGKTVAA